MKELSLKEVKVVSGGSCSWGGLAGAAIRGVVFGGYRGSLQGAVAGAGINSAIYGATCWW